PGSFPSRRPFFVRSFMGYDSGCRIGASELVQPAETCQLDVRAAPVAAAKTILIGTKGPSMPSGKDITGGGSWGGGKRSGGGRRKAQWRGQHELGKHGRAQEERLLLVLPEELPRRGPSRGRSRRRLHLR